MCFFAHDESEIRTQPVDALSGESDNAEKAEFSKAGNAWNYSIRGAGALTLPWPWLKSAAVTDAVFT